MTPAQRPSRRPARPGAARGKSARPARPPRPAPAQRRQEPEPIDVHDPDGVRLQKLLAAAGLGSRRACEGLISAGRVTVDGQVVTELGVRVDPRTATVEVDGLRVALDTDRVVLALNKPRGVVSTMDDPQGRPSLAQYVADRPERLFHVGRLDTDSEGLLLLTNDGDLAQRLAHPAHGVEKTYLVHVEGRVSRAVEKRLLAGVELDDGPVTVDRYKVVEALEHQTLVEVTLHSGRNRVVRRLFAEVGHPVVALVRTRFGPIRLGELRPGRTRVLGRTELGSLLTSVGL